ncbi:MAG: PepSY-associated TM helix domain-containing protein, partial [Pseudomonadota bacterium]
ALIVGGLIAYWPARRGWRRGLRAAGPSRIELLSVHRNLGTYVALPSLIVALSGAALAFPSTSRALFDQFGGPRATPLETPAPAFKPARSVDWSNALAAATRAFPDASPRIVVWPRGERGAQIRLRRPGEWHPNGRTRIVFDAATGAATLYENAMAQGAGRRAYNALYPVHAAHVGGRVYDAVVFLTGTGLSVLGVLGVLAFAKRTRPQAPTPERRTVTSDRIKNGSGAQNKESRASDGCNKKAPTP